MMLAESGGPLTPTGMHEIHHPTDLSPRSSLGSESSARSDSQTSSPSPNSNDNMLGTQQLYQALSGNVPQFISEDLSPLQRLQYAFEQTTILSNLFQGQKGGDVAAAERPERPSSLPSPPTPTYRECQRDRGVTHLSSPYAGTKGAEGKQPIPTPPGSPNSDPANIFQCPLCSIVCNGRHSFNEHLVTHTQHHACPKCDYLTSSEEKLRDHLQGMHDLSDPVEALEEEETSVPKLNAQGKVKTFKCKQCDHLSLTKAESWTHSATHIRPEKMLKCPKCSFVTEYKHHLEYHLRIHVGSKPYQCNVCSYTCVNKSMLNSHLKSHSAVYQYNCLDCDYQTKYCHSLKMHLRKLNHRPSMVLNPDGTPNPLPIIDVYGTRRGPKMKKSQPIPAAPKLSQNQPMGIRSPTTSSHGNNSSNGSYSSHPNDSLDELMSPKLRAEPMEIPQKGRKSKSGPPPPTPKRPLHGDDMSLGNQEAKSQPSSQASPLLPQGHFERRPTESMNKTVLELSKNPLELYAVALNQYLLANPLLFTAGAPEQLARMAKEHEKQMAHLTKQNGNQQFFHRAGHEQQSPHHPIRMHQVSPQILSPDPIPSHQTALDLRNPKSESERRRRKGKALRYERHSYEEETFGDVALDFSNNNYRAQQGGKGGMVAGTLEEPQEYKVQAGPLMCKYCEISFPDHILYRMHMSYHSGDKDPFVCKSCGKKTQDKVDFFLHLTTDSH